MIADPPGDHQTIEEFLALLRLDPDFSIVVVEGRTDAAFYGQYLRSVDVDMTVTSVGDRFTISREECAPFSKDFGEKTKAVALAIRVNNEIGSAQNRITVLVDADTSASLGPILVSSGCLISTDLPSLEHYSMQQAPFARFTAFGVRKAEAPNSVQVTASIGGALRALSAIGATLHDHGVRMTDKAISFCSTEAGVIRVDAPKVIERSLASHAWNGRARLDAPELLSICAGYLRIFEESKHPGRGRDVAPLLILLLKLGKPFNNPEVVEALLRASLHPDDLHEWPLFSKLRSRYALT